MKLIGDMAIQDLTPKSTNIGDRIVKNMRICGSGIYTYAVEEAPLLNLGPVPAHHSGIKFINVYRPPEVLTKYKDYFARVPIITGHHVKVDRENAKRLVVGMVGDAVSTEVDKTDGETYLYTTGTIVAGDGVDAYEKYGQLSVGYDPIIEWEDGEHNGVPYQAVLRGFNDVNHLLICKVARGGPQCMVMDSLDGSEYSPLEMFVHKHDKTGGEDMSIFNKIFGSVKKEKLAGDSGIVVTLLQSISAGADPATQIQKVKEIVGDSDPTFNGYLDELSQAKNEKPEVISKAVDIVVDHYKKLAGDTEDKPEEKKPEEKKPAGDEEKCPKCGKAPCECGDEKKPEDKEEKKSAGDSLDVDALVEKVAAKVVEKLTPTPKEEKPMQGDEVVNQLNTPINGDAKTNTKNSTEFMNEIFGGL